MNPRISIILPTYRTAPGLAAAIESVQAQTFSEWELLVVDDGLFDEPKKTLEDCVKKDQRIISIDNGGNKGVQISLNHGLAMAKGEFIARIDDDDIWIDPEKMAKQIAFLQTNPDCVLVGTNAMICNEASEKMTYALPLTDSEIRKRMLVKNCFIHPSVMMRKSAVEKVGNYSEDTKLKHIEDYDLWLRLGCVGQIANLPSAAVQLTVHTDSVTFKNRLAQSERLWMIIYQYKKYYPNFILARIILSVRIAGFLTLEVVSLPATWLYAIQRVYKRL